MILCQTEKQVTEAAYPSKLDVGRILLKRHLQLPQKVKEDILRTQKGEQGERQVIEAFEQFGRKHWLFLHNVWLDFKGRFEYDLIVITYASIYVFEIKNYDGVFTYENGDCSINGYDLSENCIAQANRAYKKMIQLCDESYIDVNIHGAIIFAGEYSRVEIKSPINNIQVVVKNQLKSYIQQIIAEEENYFEMQFNVEKLMQRLSKYSIADPFKIAALSDEDMKEIKGGICCAHCNSFDVDIKKTYVHCDCGFHEPREEAIIRTICEYGALRYDKNLSATKILKFLKNQISHTNLYLLLGKHFEKIKVGKYVVYINKRLPYEKIRRLFEIALPKKLYLDNESFILYAHEWQKNLNQISI